MGFIYTKKKDENSEKTIQTEDFIDRIMKMKRKDNEKTESPKIENVK